jgi:IclR family transcriptional regulator, KDG regulon repressor
MDKAGTVMSLNQSLAHSLDILLLYDFDRPVFTVAEISKRLGYSQSKTYRLVRTFIRYGFLAEDRGTSRYSLGLNLLRLGFLARRQFDISTIALPFMKELSNLTKETVLLTAVNGTKGVVLERVESEEPVRVSLFQPGASLPLHGGASSKVLMAHLPEEDWERIIGREGLKRFTSATITQVNHLKADLRKIRRKGYAFSDEEVDQHVRAVAAPILNGWGELVAGLSIAGPVFRILKKNVPQLSKLVIEYADKISFEMGFQSNPSRSKD